MYLLKLLKFKYVIFLILLAVGEGKKGVIETIVVDEENFMILILKEGIDIIYDLEILIELIGLIGDFRMIQRKES